VVVALNLIFKRFVKSPLSEKSGLNKPHEKVGLHPIAGNFKIDTIGKMNNLISLALTIGGIVLIVYGIYASDSLGSDISRFFTGAPTDKTIWLLIGGIVMLAVGVGGRTFNKKSL